MSSKNHQKGKDNSQKCVDEEPSNNIRKKIDRNQQKSSWNTSERTISSQTSNESSNSSRSRESEEEQKKKRT